MRRHGLIPIVFGLILLLSLPLLNISCGGDDNSLNDFTVSPYYPRNGQDQVDLLPNGILGFAWSVYPTNVPYGAVYDLQWSTDPNVFLDADVIPMALLVFILPMRISPLNTKIQTQNWYLNLD
ncbi:MAG: hypothetical protein HQK56_08230 [Deltaproteobacteria bacterium]|nr:hypothetical protein [Deltaproteobacteria bacterium]